MAEVQPPPPVDGEPNPTVATPTSEVADETVPWLGKIWQKRKGHRGRALALALELGHAVVICMQSPAWWLQTPSERENFYRSTRGKKFLKESYAATSFQTYEEFELWHETVSTARLLAEALTARRAPAAGGGCAVVLHGRQMKAVAASRHDPTSRGDSAPRQRRCPEANAASSRYGLRRAGGGQPSTSIRRLSTARPTAKMQKQSWCKTAWKASATFSSTTTISRG